MKHVEYTMKCPNGKPMRPPHLRKVKSGCRTCKRRKVKCDEKWPTCERCQSTGRKCEGYGIWGGGSDCSVPREMHAGVRAPKSQPGLVEKQVTVSKPLPMVTIEASERDSFEWYIRRSSSKLPGLFGSEDWTRLLLQACSTEPAVKHALLTLSSAHKEEVSGANRLSPRTNRNLQQSLFTMTQYSKAIHHLQPWVLNKRRASVHIALISCVLFVSTEFLRGYYKSGILHLDCGLRLLRRYMDCNPGSDPFSMRLDGWLITMLGRFLVQAKLLGQTSMLRCEELLFQTLEPKYEIFRSIHHMRRKFDHILLCVLDLREQASRIATVRAPAIDAEMRCHQDHLRQALELWFKTYNATQRQLGSKTPFMERFTYEFFELNYQMAYVLTETCVDPLDEMVYDRYESMCAKICSRCVDTEALVFSHEERSPRDTRDPEPTSPNSISDSGWVPPLHFVAIKCRNPYIRRQALRLLQLSPHKEGIWNAVLSAELAKKVIEIEEDSFFSDMNLDANELSNIIPDGNLSLPPLPDHLRLRDMTVSLPNDTFGQLGFSCHRHGQNGQITRISWEFDLGSQTWAQKTTKVASDCDPV